MAIDREENHDVADANPTIVKGLLDIIAGYAKTEVSVQEARFTIEASDRQSLVAFRPSSHVQSDLENDCGQQLVKQYCLEF